MAPRLLDAAGAAVLAVAASLAAHVALHSPIRPLPMPPRPPARHPPNGLLQGLEKLGEGRLSGPEDVFVAGGEVYTATRDGWLQRMHRNGTWEKWALVGGSGMLGIAPSAAGGVLVCDADKGLLRVGEDGRVTLLAAAVADGSPIRFADDVVEASDGTVYFSDASARFGFDSWFLDLLESRFTGRLLRYDPRAGAGGAGEASVVLDSLGFANGVALSRDESFLVVCETMRYRCLRLWLKGEKAGEAETFADELPGSPDNVRLAPDGSFWLALIQLRSPWYDLVTRWEVTRRVVAAFPALMERVKATMKGAMVAQLSEDGEVVRVLDDAEGKVINFVTTATESGGDLFLGSLVTDFIGKLALPAKEPRGQAEG